MKKKTNKEWCDIDILAEKYDFTIGPPITREETRAEAEKERERVIATTAMVNKVPVQCPEPDKYYQAGLRARRFADRIIEFFKPAFLVIAGLMVIAFAIGYMVLTLLVLAAVPWAGVVLLIPVFLVCNMLIGR